MYTDSLTHRPSKQKRLDKSNEKTLTHTQNKDAVLFNVCSFQLNPIYSESSSKRLKWPTKKLPFERYPAMKMRDGRRAWMRGEAKSACSGTPICTAAWSFFAAVAFGRDAGVEPAEEFELVLVRSRGREVTTARTGLDWLYSGTRPRAE